MKQQLLIPGIAAAVAFCSTPTLTNANQHSEPEVKAYALDSNGKILDSTVVDAFGNYAFNKLPKGSYLFTLKKRGYENIDIQGVEHLGSSINYHANLEWQYDYVQLHTELLYDSLRSKEVSIIPRTIVLHDGVAVAERGSRADGNATFIDGQRLIGAGRAESLVKTNPAAVTTATGISVRGTRTDASVTYMESERVEVSSRSSGDVSDGYVSKSASYDEPMVARKSPIGTIPMEKSGQITAGVWRDLDNWNKWIETNKESTISDYQKTWGFYHKNRFSAVFNDSKGNPVIGEKVILKDGAGNIAWTAVTDNTGKAEFWADLNGTVYSNETQEYKVSIGASERRYDFKIKPYNGGAEIINLPIEYKTKPIAEIAFVVDATGSMGDEIRYLQAELLDVIGKVKSTNKCLDVRVGSVFYRDNGDEYLTRKSDFSTSPVNVVDFIYQQSANGGGDFPEAVDAALETTIDSLSWSEKAVSKILFLVLDAPPHDDAASKEKMRKYAAAAASKGIKIIPITASGINQSTEFLMKYLAITTNGTYVYITDHSGIGGVHSKPTGVKENVQYLNDLMVDIITENTAWKGCTDTTQNTQTGTVEIVSNGQWQAQFYPNPSIDHIVVKSNIIPDEIGLYNLSGAEVYKTTQTAEKTRIETANFPTGIYIVKCRKGSEQISCRMLVMH
ncbi:MAG: T9SS type A sorting domain-containing protein [Bacteroidia bacterium]|nr:T9SS type A sorting domain-containing protein [Bacteroidia bacterium]